MSPPDASGPLSAGAARRRYELALALAALAAALLANSLAGDFIKTFGARPPACPDLLLDRLPHWDTRPLFTWGFAVFLVWAGAATLLWERRRAPYIIWGYALLIAVRSFFIILTPLGRPEGALELSGDPLFDHVGRYLTTQQDFFFSSHTALPFLGFLVFRGRWVRLSFLGLSVLLAAAVLLARLHYSIDVFSAYLITYAVHLAEIRWVQRHYRSWLGFT